MIIPAILENSIDEIQKKINLVDGLVERIQIDIYDGIFGNEITPEQGDLLDLDFAGLAVDIHLMTVDPIDFLADCPELKKKVKNLRIIGQIERMDSQIDFVVQAHKIGCQAGLALDAYTPANSLDKSVVVELAVTDCILAMSVKAGYSGQYFIQSTIEKIYELGIIGVQKRPGLFKKAGPFQTFQIVVDGGLNPEAVKICRQAGATSFAVGSWLWEHKDIVLAIKELNESVK